MTVLNLFRGQAIGVSVDVIGDGCIVTIEVEDYNRLPPLLAVGAPSGDTGLTQADGTVIWQDARAQYGIESSFAASADGGYWPDTAPVLDLVTGFLAADIPGLPTWDWTTAMSDLKSYADFLAPRVSGALRWWIAPPASGDGLILYWVDFLDPVQVALLPAPYAIDNDAPDWTTSLMPITLGPFTWDWAAIRGSTYVRGGTPVPEGSGWATGDGNTPTGTAYIDAPGAITEADRDAIGDWHQTRTLVELLRGSATMPGFLGDTTFFGWAPGQTVPITSVKHSRFVGHELDARPEVIQKVTGRMTSPIGGLAISIDGTPLTARFEWRSLEFAASMNGAEKAKVVIHLLGDADTLTIPTNADIWITLDDTDPSDFVWDLDVGDIPAGSLARELAKVEPPVTPPTYRFNVLEADPDGVKRGIAEAVTAQIADGAGTPIALPGVPVTWTLLQWEDEAETIPGALLVLDLETGTTDSAGRLFNLLTPSEVLPADYTWTLGAVALPVA